MKHMSEMDWGALVRQIQAHSNNKTVHLQCLDALAQEAQNRTAILKNYHPDVEAILLELLAGDVAKHQRLEPLASLQLRFKHGITREQIPRVDEVLLEKLAADALLAAVLEKSFVTSAELEKFLISVRRELLNLFSKGQAFSSGLLLLTAALACQGFNNEYVWWQSEEEQEVLQRNDQHLPLLAKEDSERFLLPEQQAYLAVRGMYMPLVDLPLAVQAAKNLPQDGRGHIAAMLTRLVLEPLEERNTAQNIVSLGSMSNRVSQEVRAHYEANPFPRWHNLGPPFPPLRVRLQELGPLPYPLPAKAGKLGEALVAGCGTGQQPLAMAKDDPDTHYTAIDLSLASLSYAKRMAQRLGINNVTFLQMDLLDVAELGKQFHHVECVGVLHCLQDPMAGWQALRNVTCPGGTWHIGVYSRLARMPTEKVRQEIKRRGLQPTTRDMRAMRKSLLDEPFFDNVRPYLLDRDFFSLSMFRDLFFHQHEYCYTLSEIEQQMKNFECAFVAFRALEPLMQKYQTLYPQDPGGRSFDNWRAFEPHYAGTREMFRLWLQFMPGREQHDG